MNCDASLALKGSSICSVCWGVVNPFFPPTRTVPFLVIHGFKEAFKLMTSILASVSLLGPALADKPEAPAWMKERPSESRKASTASSPAQAYSPVDTPGL